jgi:hypothetical protein
MLENICDASQEFLVVRLGKNEHDAQPDAIDGLALGYGPDSDLVRDLVAYIV